MKVIEITPKQLLLLCILRNKKVTAINLKEYRGSCLLYNEFARKIDLKCSTEFDNIAEDMLSQAEIKKANVQRIFVAYNLAPQMIGFDLCELHHHEEFTDEIIWYWFASDDSTIPVKKFEYAGNFLVEITSEEEFLLEKYYDVKPH